MVKLRLRRVGKKKQPVYKIVAAHSQAARNGKYIEAIGRYNPRMDPMVIDVKEERLFAWLKRGAQPSDTLRSLLQRKGLWLKWGMMKKGADEAAIAARLEQWQMMQEEKLRREKERKARQKAAKKKKVQAAVTEAAPAPSPAPAEAVTPAPEAPAPPPA